eukprot:UN01443
MILRSRKYKRKPLIYLDENQPEISHLLVKLNQTFDKNYSERGWLDTNYFKQVKLPDDYVCVPLRGESGVECIKDCDEETLVGEMVGSFIMGKRIIEL